MQSHASVRPTRSVRARLAFASYAARGQLTCAKEKRMNVLIQYCAA